MINTKKILSIVLMLTLISIFSFAQTNVSGGIYTNTTWTLAGSPYIVVDTVVVFPGITLTIDPGVVVKFANNKRLEIRQASLIAVGTITDSITFTSNSGAPTPGIWDEIWLNGIVSLSHNSKFNYCNLLYSNNGLRNGTGYYDTLIIKNSNFSNNNRGISNATSSANGVVRIDTCSFTYNTNYGIQSVLSANINFCNFSYNQTGLRIESNGFDLFTKVINCVIEFNQTGLYNLQQRDTIVNCIVRHNQTGIKSHNLGNNLFKNCQVDSNSVVGIHFNWSGNDSITDCLIRYNGIGFRDDDGAGSPVTNNITKNIIENNTIGILLANSGNNIYCNKICNNTTYDLQYTVAFGSNTSVANNYWCTPDSISTTARIYDGYDNVSLGLVNFMPLDTSNCYLTGCNLQLTTNVTNATCDTCHNGSATVNVTNGFAPYTYTWLTSPIQTTQTATGLASGIYTVCVSDVNGCTACDSTVFVDSTNCTGFSVSTQATNATCATCTDGTATANVNLGTPPYSYTWYTSPVQTTQTATGLGQGNYAVCVTDLYGCVACDTATVGVGNCSAQFNLFPDTILHHYFAVNMASGIPPLSYSWNWGDGSPVDTLPYPNHTYSTAGFYTICLTITDSVGCTDTHCTSYYLTRATDAMIYVNVVASLPTGISNHDGNNLFSVFPNPALSTLSIASAENVVATDIRIYNMLGELKLTSAITSQRTNIDISALSAGVYFVEVISESKIGRQKFIKQ